nr:hypothetical protein [Actinomadura harenae]
MKEAGRRRVRHADGRGHHPRRLVVEEARPEDAGIGEGLAASDGPREDSADRWIPKCSVRAYRRR